ncbi:hypothetical protein GCM10027277_06740 [Pseudoduganella ginsengisoli]|uniref:Uncharacterized protein n=1 Tax=Pseudoduganella ginsengisoli TaxID=1462440 RepID=A0A6L6Q5V4_9BURK|nr:hypothetical protein [Pseudoduganella ginsengisoli]MTW05263.1 hypothetical protein [Pseudoduganella ginsengisoli]
MLTSAAPAQDMTCRIFATLSDHLAWPDDAEQYLRLQLDLAISQPEGLPPHYDLLGNWLHQEAEQALAAYHAYQQERAAGGPRRHFANMAQMRQFLASAAPARLTAGASLYGVLSRWEDEDFQPMVASYLDYTGHGIPSHNQYLQYRALLEANGAVPLQPQEGAACRSAAVELALARHADVHLAELIGYNLGRQQPSAALLAARYELNELGAEADAFAAPADAAGSAPSALFTLRGVMARVSDPGAFYRRVDNGYRLYRLAGRIELPAATPGPQAIMPPRDTLDAPPQRRASYAPAPLRQPERPLIRHPFPEDEHAWEAIGSELRLLEARLASSESKEEAMQILARLMTPGEQHTQVGLMAARIFSQLFRL